MSVVVNVYPLKCYIHYINKILYKYYVKEDHYGLKISSLDYQLTNIGENISKQVIQTFMQLFS
jgi:hypothetical protein